MCGVRYTIITPTILRESLLRCCESVERQTFKDWQHVVMVDCEITNDLIGKISHPQRIVMRCERPHKNWGHTCRHNAWKFAKGEYILNLDDDNYLADEKVLEDLQVVEKSWAIFPILRYGERFFHDPPMRLKVDTGSMLIKRTLGAWPDSAYYDADGRYAENLVKQHSYDSLKNIRPLLVMPASNDGRVEAAAVEVSDKLRITIFTPAHSNAYLWDAYESIKDQDFHEWIVVYNNGGVPIEFSDPRVKSHLLYKAPDKVGTLKAYACEHATGDVLLELDCDDLLAPNAVEEVRKAFENPEIGFAYSNAIHATTDLAKFPRYDESYGWKYREAEFRGKKLDEFVSFSPTPESVSRVWYGPDHLRAFRRTVYQKVGGHNKDMRVLDDSDLVIRMYLETKFQHIDKPLYVYRVHGENSWLKYNEEIQKNVWPLYDQKIEYLVQRWAALNGLPMVEVGGFSAGLGWQVVGTKDANWEFPDSSVGVVRSLGSFSQMRDPLALMKEVYRVLVPGGWLICQVPSSEGRGGFQDPRTQSFWNENSFLYYTNRDWARFIGTPVRFQAVRLYTTEPDQKKVSWVVANLVSLKDGYRPPGLIEI